MWGATKLRLTFVAFADPFSVSMDPTLRRGGAVHYVARQSMDVATDMPLRGELIVELFRGQLN
jgi:hypothetical protein